MSYTLVRQLTTVFHCDLGQGSLLCPSDCFFKVLLLADLWLNGVLGQYILASLGNLFDLSSATTLEVSLACICCLVDLPQKDTQTVFVIVFPAVQGVIIHLYGVSSFYLHRTICHLHGYKKIYCKTLRVLDS